MKVTLLNSKGNKKLILFFNGWGMDERAISHIPSNDFDVIMINEYHDLSFDITPLFKYEMIFVVAWSLGVWVANKWISNSNIIPSKTIALNGTLAPIHSKNGIAPEAFQGTIDNWDEHSRTKFQMRMFKDRNVFSNNISKLPIRSISEQKNELTMLQQSINNSPIDSVVWDKVFIGIDDLIFTPENQQHFWNGETTISLVSMPHFPFLELQTWELIIE